MKKSFVLTLANTLESIAGQAASSACLGWLGEPNDTKVREILNIVD